LLESTCIQKRTLSRGDDAQNEISSTFVPRFLYVIHQNSKHHPMLCGWMDEALSVLSADSEWSGVELKRKEADDHNAFDVRDVFSVVKGLRCSVVVLGQLKSSSIALLHERLAQRYVIVHRREVTDSTDVYDAFRDALARHKNGEPFVPRRLAVALMLVRKLKRGHYWGGDAKAKAFLSIDELAKGRGVDEQYRDVAAEVANQMQLKGLFKRKTGDGHAKYALNASRSADLHAFLGTWKAADRGLQQYLYGDIASVPARDLAALLEDVAEGEGGTATEPPQAVSDA
jgi:hypothetical protein